MVFFCWLIGVDFWLVVFGFGFGLLLVRLSLHDMFTICCFDSAVRPVREKSECVE